MSHGFNIGDVVSFGTDNGQKTKARVIKLNAKTAKCVSLDARGRHPVGTEWKVAYSALTKLDASGVELPKAPMLPAITGSNLPIEFNRFLTVENHLYDALLQIYSELSPENLTGDGEIPISQVRLRKTRLERFQKGIFAALGRVVSEDQIYAWDRSRTKWIEENKKPSVTTHQGIPYEDGYPGSPLARRENRWNQEPQSRFNGQVFEELRNQNSLASQIDAVENDEVIR